MAREPLHLKAALAYLAEHGETRAKALALGVQISDATLLSGIKSALARGEILVRRDGREVYYRLPEQGAEESTLEAAPKFNAALWADGELVLWNVKLDADGKRLTLDAEKVAMLRGLLTGGV